MKFINKIFLCLTFLLSNCGMSFASEDLMQNEIKHVVIMMLENRSFDNVLGWLYENQKPDNFIPGNTYPNYLGLSDETLNQFTNVLRNSKNEIVFTSSPIKGLPSLNNDKLINSPKFDPNEPFNNVTVQIYNGGSEPSMSGFLQDYATLWDEDDWISQRNDICAVMETYTEKELPVIHALAKHYAVSDYYFSSVPTQTNPNRAFSICGTSDGQINNGLIGESHFSSDTLWNRLYEESPETSWTVFWQSDFIPVICKGPFYGTNFFSSVKRIPNLDQHFKKLDEFHALARKGELPDVSLLEPQWTLSANLSPKEKEIIEEFCRNQEFIVGFQGNDCHPPGDVRTAENFVANVYTSLIANEAAWNNTLFIIVFDEHGGLFDHVSPPKAVPPDNQNQNGFNFDRYGVRIPAIFISPRIAKGTVIRSDDPNIPFDHTSIIAMILKWKKIDKSKWNLGNRAATAPTFDSVITLENPRVDSILPIANDVSAAGNPNTEVQMGDRFFIKNAEGQYLVKPEGLLRHYARLGSVDNRIAFTFAEGTGNLTVGSFALLQCCDPSLGEMNLLQTANSSKDCFFAKNAQHPSQWWIIKCMDNSCTGSNIHYGDRVYIENHTYLDLIQYVPARLTKADGLFETNCVTTISILNDEAEQSFWILEKDAS